MTYLAVLFYEAGNPEGMPTTMARDLMERGDAAPVPAGYQAWTQSDWEDHVLVNQASWDSATFAARLQAAMGSRISELAAEVGALIYAQYDAGTQSTLSMMYSETAFNGLVDRRAHIDTAWAWINAMLDTYYVAKDAVLAATTPEDAAAVVADYTPAGAAPAVSITSARAITT